MFASDLHLFRKSFGIGDNTGANYVQQVLFHFTTESLITSHSRRARHGATFMQEL